MFKNATFFTFPPGSIDLLAAERTGLFAECALKPIGPLELSTRGFIQPLPDDVQLAPVLGIGLHLLTVGGEDKVLPGSAVQAELAKRISAIEEKEGRKLGNKARKRLKDDLLHELLPKALSKPVRTDAIIDTQRGLLIVDTSSRRVAEGVACEIRRALGSFPALPPNAELAPRSVLTGWLGGEMLPEELSLGDEAILKDALEGGAVARVTGQELLSDEIAQHLEAGKQVTRLALNLEDHLSFTIDEDLVVRKLKFLEAAVEALENVEREDLRAELVARSYMTAIEVGGLYDLLQRILKLTQVHSLQ